MNRLLTLLSLPVLVACGSKDDETGVVIDWTTCQAGDAGPGAEDCDAEWTCDDVTLYVSCHLSTSTGTWTCTCRVNDGMEYDATTDDPGCSENSGVSEAAAASLCAWEL